MRTTVARAARRPARSSSAIRERISAVSCQWFMPPPGSNRHRRYLPPAGGFKGGRIGAQPLTRPNGRRGVEGEDDVDTDRKRAFLRKVRIERLPEEKAFDGIPSSDRGAFRASCHRAFREETDRLAEVLTQARAGGVRSRPIFRRLGAPRRRRERGRRRRGREPSRGRARSRDPKAQARGPRTPEASLLAGLVDPGDRRPPPGTVFPGRRPAVSTDPPPVPGDRRQATLNQWLATK